MAITSAGVGSGLDIEGIVSQLMLLERKPLNRLETRKTQYQAQLSAYGQLKSAVSTFQTAMSKLDTISDFKLFKATSADESYYTATADSTASVGTFNVEVQRLAQAHKLQSTVYADTDTTLVGGGDLSLTVNGSSFTVTGAGSLTLAGLRDAINNDTNNVGVTASIVTQDTAGTQNYLVLTSNNTGDTYQITPGGTTSLGLTNINTPGTLDAQILVDNTFTINRSSNTISDAITGVTLNLKAVSTGPVNVKIDRDNTEVKKVVQGFVDSYNALHDVIKGLRGKGGALEADNSLLSIERTIKSVFNTPPTGITSSYSYLSETGVAFDKTGKLTLDSTKLDTAINTDFSGLAELYANDNQGYAYRLKAATDSILSVDGLVDSREDGLNTTIKNFDSRIEREEFRLQLVEKRLRSQFTALDTLVGTLSATGNFLNQQLTSLQNLAENRN